MTHSIALGKNAQPTPERCRSERVWDFPTSILQRKICICAHECTACSNNASFQSAYEPICAAILYMSFHNVFCRSSQPCIRSELQWCGFVFLPKGFDKACTAGITRSMGHLFNTEVGMDKQLRCLVIRQFFRYAPMEIP